MRKLQVILSIIVFSLAGFLIFFNFTGQPRVWIDEGIFTEVAKNLAQHVEQGIQIAPHKIVSSAVVATSGYPLIFPVTLSFWLFGVGLWQARLPMLIFMFLLTAAFYFFVRARHSFGFALSAVLLLLSFSPFYGNGRPVQGEVPGTMFLVLGSLVFYYWERGLFSDRRLAMSSGMLLGLAAASKPLFLIVLIPTVLISLMIFLKREVDSANLSLFFIGLAIPIILWIAIQFPSFILFKQALVGYYSGNSVSSAPVWPLIKSNLISFFTETTPAFFLLLMVLTFGIFSYFYFYLGERLFSRAEFILFLYAGLNALAYLKGPPWYRHFFSAQILSFLLFSCALSTLYDRQSDRRLKISIVVFLAGLIVFQFYHLVFLSQNSPLDRSDQNRILEEGLSQIGPSKTVLFYDSIGAVIFLKHDNYYQYLKPTDYLLFGDSSLNNLSYDYVLTRNAYNLKCYDSKELGKYYLFERRLNCKK